MSPIFSADLGRAINQYVKSQKPELKQQVGALIKDLKNSPYRKLDIKIVREVGSCGTGYDVLFLSEGKLVDICCIGPDCRINVVEKLKQVLEDHKYRVMSHNRNHYCSMKAITDKLASLWGKGYLSVRTPLRPGEYLIKKGNDIVKAWWDPIANDFKKEVIKTV